MSDCIKDECEDQDEQGNCRLMECKYYIDKETAGDMKYHELKDEDRLDKFGRKKDRNESNNA